MNRILGIVLFSIAALLVMRMVAGNAFFSAQSPQAESFDAGEVTELEEAALRNAGRSLRALEPAPTPAQPNTQPSPTPSVTPQPSPSPMPSPVTGAW